MKNFAKNIALWLIIGLLLIALFNLFQGTSNNRVSSMISFSDFCQQLILEIFQKFILEAMMLKVFLKMEDLLKLILPIILILLMYLMKGGIKITAEPADKSMHPMLSILLSWFPMLLLIGVWIFFMRQMQGGGGKAYGFWQI